jgi:hypothetical protein
MADDRGSPRFARGTVWGAWFSRFAGGTKPLRFPLLAGGTYNTNRVDAVYKNKRD